MIHGDDWLKYAYPEYYTELRQRSLGPIKINKDFCPIVCNANRICLRCGNYEECIKLKQKGKNGKREGGLSKWK